MTDFFLIRHAINDWVKTGRLAGWTPGVHLNPEGQTQARQLGEHLAKTNLTAVYASPLERAMETAEAIVAHHTALTVQQLDDIGELRFGEWQGKKLSKLRRHSLWETVQVYPSRVQFPGGESIRQAQARAVNAIERLAQRHPNQRVAVVSHSDILKLVVAHYLGAHLDFYQRIEIAPASITILRLGANRPHIACVNNTGHLPARHDAAVKSEPRRRRSIPFPWR